MKHKSTTIILLSLGLFFLTTTLVFAEDIHDSILLPELPGQTGGTGTFFEITDSEYLNITLDSQEEIKLIMESIPEMVTMMIKPAFSVFSASSTQITLSGFMPSTTYYKVQDEYHSIDEFVSDENGSYTYIQDLSGPHFVFIQPQVNTKFIKDDPTGGDCTLIGAWNANTKTCTLTTDPNETIQIDNDNITLDGNNHFLTGANTGIGVHTYRKTNITIKNLNIRDFFHGLYLLYSLNNTLINNSINSNAYTGLLIFYSHNNTVSSNNIISNNRFYGIRIVNSSNNTILNNTAQENGDHDLAIEVGMDIYCNNTIQDNIGSGGREIKYFNHSINLENEILSELILCNADGSTINNVTIRGSETKKNNGIRLFWTDYSTITNSDSSGNLYGIGLSNESGNNTITNSTFNSNGGGIFTFRSDNNTISNNTISLNDGLGIILWISDNNKIYNNNFINNLTQAIVTESSSGNLFNLLPPIGGNYWSDFDAPEEGCYDINNDDFCDAPYTFLGGEDRYPFMEEVGAVSLSQGAAILAKELVNHPEAYLWSGKGWDYNLAEFVSSANILSGYTYRNPILPGPDIGIGVDCSGLITWAFNRLSNSFLPAVDNFVKYVNANGLYGDYQSDAIEEIELLPGDAIFFDWDNNGFIDHTAMYVGESGGFDVVNAKGRDFGIVTEIKDNYRQLDGFQGFRRIHEGSIGMEVVVGSPVDLSVTDPDGFTITADSVISSDEEYIREIPGVLYYLELERGHDGDPIDRVYSPIVKTGDYIIKTFPAIGASPAETYVLDFAAGDQLITLAQDVPVSQIPTHGYGITILEIGDINSFIPVAIDVRPGSDPNTINLKSKGVIPVAVLTDGFFDAENIAIDSVLFTGVSSKKGKLEDIDNDGDLDLILHFETQDLQLTPEDIEATLTGQLADDSLIKGTDSVKVISPGKSKKQSQALIGLIPLCIIGVGWLIYKRKPKFPRNVIERIKRIKIKK